MKAFIQSFHSDVIWDNYGNSFFKITAELENHQVISKTVSFDDYKALLFGAQKETVSFYHFDLPQYFYKGALSNQKSSFKVILFVPAARRQFVSTNLQIATQIPYPNLLFYLDVRRRSCKHKMCYALADTEPDSNSILYNYPYGNVSTNGDICMGNIAVKLEDISKSDQFVTSFLEGIDEGHYYTPGVMAKPFVSEGELIQKVVQLDEFPQEWLVKSKSYNKKVKDLIQYLQ